MKQVSVNTMWSAYRYVLTLLFFEVVASVPYSPTYFKNQELSTISDAKESSSYQNVNNSNYEQVILKIENANQTPLVQQRYQDSYLPRSLPAFMSPIPTKRESRQINNAVEDIFPRQIITYNLKNYRTPRAVQPLRESMPTVNERQAPNEIKNQNPTFVNNLEAQQHPFLLTPHQDLSQPVIKRREHGGIDLIDNGHVEYNTPVNVKQSNPRKIEINNGEHMYTPMVNEPAVSERHNEQELLSSQRIRNVLSSTKHKKRYLVVHPNGRIEHIDSLEPIAKEHPNYVLINAGHIVPNSYKLENHKLQSPVIASPTQLKSTYTNTEVIFKPQLETALLENRDVGIESSSKIVSTELPPTQLSHAQNVSAESIIETETEAKPQPSLLSKHITSPEDNMETKEVTLLRNILPREESHALSFETASNSSAANATSINTEVIELPGSEQKVAGILPNANPSLAQDTIARQNEQVMENIQGKILLKDTEIIDVDSSGKPVVWFNTSDPNFWSTLTEGQDSNTIFFFNVNSRPRIEKDTTRTISPDGSVLEEITESIWYNEDDAVPVVTKTSRIIQPDNL